MDRLAAVMQGNRDRLRPILMTTLTLIAGMLPLALGTGPGAEERRAVAVVVIGGQSALPAPDVGRHACRLFAAGRCQNEAALAPYRSALQNQYPASAGKLNNRLHSLVNRFRWLKKASLRKSLPCDFAASFRSNRKSSMFAGILFMSLLSGIPWHFRC